MKDSQKSFKELVRSSVKETSAFESDSDYLKNTLMSISEKERHTISALSIQLKDSQSLLALQQQEALKTTEHIDMMNSVVDSLNATIKQQSGEILSLKQANTILKEQLEKTEEGKSQAHVERKTFIELEEQTKSLLETIKEKNLEIGDIKVELKYLREMKQDSIFVDEMKVKRMEESNISLPLENQKLKKRLSISEDLNTSLRKKVTSLEVRLKELEEQLLYQENYTVESMAKINRLEFGNILRLDKLFEESREIERREDQLKKKIHVFKENNTELKSQIEESVNKIQLVETVCGNIIDNAEKVLNEKKIEIDEHIQDKKKLRLEVKTLREIIEKASQRGQYYVLGDKSYYEYKGETIEGKVIDIEAPSLHKIPTDMVKRNHLTTANFNHSQSNISSPLSKIHPMTKFTSTTGLDQRDKGIFPIIDMLNARQGLFYYDMKTQMLENYLKVISSSLCLSTAVNSSFLHENESPQCNIFSKTFLDSLMSSSKVINLSNCSLVDQDIETLISILRKLPSIPLLNLKKIDLSNNQITNEGVKSLFNWYMSLSSQEITNRKQRLEIDCQINNIRLDPLGNIKRSFKLRPEIYKVDFLNSNDDNLVIFGESNSDLLTSIGSQMDEDPNVDIENEERVSVLSVINFNNQRGWKTARNPDTIGETSL